MKKKIVSSQIEYQPPKGIKQAVYILDDLKHMKLPEESYNLIVDAIDIIFRANELQKQYWKAKKGELITYE